MTRTAGGVEYELTRKAVKNLNLRVRADGTDSQVQRTYHGIGRYL